MHWLILTLISALARSATSIAQKALLSDKQNDPYAFAFVFQVSVAALFAIYTLVTRTLEFPDISHVQANIVLMTLLYGVGTICTFKAFKSVDASEVAIIFASSSIWSVVSALVFLGEKISALNVLGIVLITAGVVTINYRKTRWNVERGHMLALIAACLFGLAFTNDAYIIGNYTSVASYMIPAFALPGVFVLLVNPKSIRRVRKLSTPATMLKVLFAAFFYAISAVTIFTAYKHGGQASIISPISQTNIIFTVLLSYVLLKERQRMPQKLIGMVLAFVGVLFLV